MDAFSGFRGKGGFGRREGEKTLAELAQLFDVRPSQITIQGNQLLESAAAVFEQDREPAEASVDLKALHAQRQTSFAKRSAS